MTVWYLYQNVVRIIDINHEINSRATLEASEAVANFAK